MAASPTVQKQGDEPHTGDGFNWLAKVVVPIIAALILFGGTWWAGLGQAAAPTDYDFARIHLVPDHAPPGTRVSVTGHGFPANSQITVGMSYAPEDSIGTAAVDGNGNLSGTVTVPMQIDVGTYFVYLATTKVLAETPFTVDGAPAS